MLEIALGRRDAKRVGLLGVDAVELLDSVGDSLRANSIGASGEELRLRVASNNAKRLRIDDPAASQADVETTPTRDGFYLVALLIARIEAVFRWLVAANAEPSLFVALFVGDNFVLNHWGSLPCRRWSNRSSMGGKVKVMPRLVGRGGAITRLAELGQRPVALQYCERLRQVDGIPELFKKLRETGP